MLIDVSTYTRFNDGSGGRVVQWIAVVVALGHLLCIDFVQLFGWRHDARSMMMLWVKRSAIQLLRPRVASIRFVNEYPRQRQNRVAHSISETPVSRPLEPSSRPDQAPPRAHVR